MPSKCSVVFFFLFLLACRLESTDLTSSLSVAQLLLFSLLLSVRTLGNLRGYIYKVFFYFYSDEVKSRKLFLGWIFSDCQGGFEPYSTLGIDWSICDGGAPFSASNTTICLLCCLVWIFQLFSFIEIRELVWLFQNLYIVLILFYNNGLSKKELWLYKLSVILAYFQQVGSE